MAAPKGLVKLYSAWFCPFAQRAWIGLEQKGVPYSYVEVDPYSKPPELMALNPRGLVPSLDHRGKPLYESMVILEYIDEAFPENDKESYRGDNGRPSFRLLPEDPYGRAVARIWCDFVNRKVVPTFYRYLQRQEKEEQEKACEELLESYKTLSEAMDKISPEGPFFLGRDFSMVDITLVPWIIRHDILNFYRGFTVPDTPELARFNKWASIVVDVPSVKATMQDKEKLRGMYKRYADNTATSEVAIAINENKAFP